MSCGTVFTQFILRWCFQAWCMSFLPASHISFVLVVLSLFFNIFFYPPPPPHAVSVSLGLLIETCPQSVWRHSMPSGWFICSVTHRSSCCETPLHSASIWGILEWMWCISSDILLCKTVFLLLTSGCWAVTCWDDIVLFIDCTFVCLSGPLQRSHRMSWPLINSTGLVRACYPVHFLANCSSH